MRWGSAQIVVINPRAIKSLKFIKFFDDGKGFHDLAIFAFSPFFSQVFHGVRF